MGWDVVDLQPTLVRREGLDSAELHRHVLRRPQRGWRSIPCFVSIFYLMSLVFLLLSFHDLELTSTFHPPCPLIQRGRGHRHVERNLGLDRLLRYEGDPVPELGRLLPVERHQGCPDQLSLEHCRADMFEL
jgi:hypothetical protein